MKNFGHADCGIYAEVISDGEIAIGDELKKTASDEAGRLNF